METMQNKRTMKEFDTIKMPAVVEIDTYAGSAFAVNTQGEQIFINSRIMERMELEKGDQVTAYVLPNYEDKRDTIPWRAMRVDTADIAERQQPSTTGSLSTLDKEIMKTLWTDAYCDGRMWTDREISEKIEEQSVYTLEMATNKQCHESCERLHERGIIAKIKITSDATDIKTVVMWAADIRDFED